MAAYCTANLIAVTKAQDASTLYPRLNLAPASAFTYLRHLGYLGQHLFLHTCAIWSYS